MSNKNPVYFAYAAYLIVGLLFVYLRIGEFQFDPDTASYVAASEQILAGNFELAVTAYWGILPSVVLAPFLFLTDERSYAISICTYLLGLLLLFSSSRLFKVLRLKEDALFLISLIPATLYMRSRITDMLLVICLVNYLSCYFSSSKKSNLYSGLWAAFSYQTKSYALPFILLHLLVDKLLFRVSNKRLFVTLSILSFSTFLWTLVLFQKYERVTFGDSGSFARNITHPDGPTLPVGTIGYVKPVRNGFSSWDDPIIQTETARPWYPWENSTYALHFFKIIAGNSLALISYYLNFTIFAWAILIVGLVLYFRQESRTLLPAILLPIGYLVFFIRDRYLWLSWIIIAVVGFKLIDSISHNLNKKLLRFCLAMSLSLFPLKEIIKSRNSGLEYHTFYTRLKNCGINGAIAGDSDFGSAAHLVFFMKQPFLGVPKASNSKSEMFQEAKSANADFLLVLSESEKEMPFRNSLLLGKSPDFPKFLWLSEVNKKLPTACI